MAEAGTDGLERVLKRAERQDRVWVRLAAVRTAEGWMEVAIDIVSGERPPGWADYRWEYENAVFLSANPTGREVVNWLRAGRARVEPFEVSLPPLAEQVQWERRSSQSSYRFEPLPWPHVMYTLANQPLDHRSPSGSMIGPGAPSFPRFAEAAAAFFGVRLSHGGSFDSPPPTFREQDPSGRIVRVRVGVAHVDVEVEGDDLSKGVIELAHVRPGQQASLTHERSQIIQFELGGPLPPSSWVVLKEGFEWLDRRFLNWPLTATPDPGIELVPDESTQLEMLVASGEGPQVEFKRALPKNPEERRRVARTVAAFANADGGSIVFGVNDNGEITGLSPAEVNPAAEDAVTNFIRDLVTPLPEYSLNRYPVEARPDRIVFVVDVGRGDSPPYGIDPAKPLYFVRRGATTFPASADQVRALARSRPPVDSSASSPPELWRWYQS